MKYLSGDEFNKVFYRNISPSNMFLDERYQRLKIFNLNLTLVENDELTKIHEHQVYIPPEILNDGKMMGEKSDVYSLALSLEHCLTGEMPFSGCRNDVCFEICKNSDYYPSKLETLMKYCTCKESQSRWDMDRMIKFLDVVINILSLSPSFDNVEQNLQVSFSEFQLNILII